MKKEKIIAPVEVASQFPTWQSPIRGDANPENQTNDVWCWLIQTRAWPDAARRAAGFKEQHAPGWCFDRFGQSRTLLPDGSIVLIGGEHEDHYDPDFYIYNDVVVLRPDGSMEIYGYPIDVFPPTDFHSATLFGDEIFILGGLRYSEERDHSDTYVYRLRLADFSIHRVATKGQAPTWLYDHHAEADTVSRTIICSGGQVTHVPTKATIENLTTWKLDLKESSWSATETKPFQRWLLVRADGSFNELRGIEWIVRNGRSARNDELAKHFRARFSERGHVVDAALYEARLTPPISHSKVEPGSGRNEFNTHSILVNGVTVRIVETMHSIAVTVEGQLGSDALVALERHGLETYGTLEGVPYKSIHL